MQMYQKPKTVKIPSVHVTRFFGMQVYVETDTIGAAADHAVDPTTVIQQIVLVCMIL